MRVPHSLSDSSLGLLVVLLAAAGGLIWLYNAYRMGRLKRKPKGPANPRLVCLVIVAGVLLAMVPAFWVG